jgi:hypothetical protein
MPTHYPCCEFWIWVFGGVNVCHVDLFSRREKVESPARRARLVVNVYG